MPAARPSRTRASSSSAASAEKKAPRPLKGLTKQRLHSRFGIEGETQWGARLTPMPPTPSPAPRRAAGQGRGRGESADPSPSPPQRGRGWLGGEGPVAHLR